MIRRFILDFAQSSSPHNDDDDVEEDDDDGGDDGDDDDDDDEEGDGEEDGDPCIQRGSGSTLGLPCNAKFLDPRALAGAVMAEVASISKAAASLSEMKKTAWSTSACCVT